MAKMKLLDTLHMVSKDVFKAPKPLNVLLQDCIKSSEGKDWYAFYEDSMLVYLATSLEGAQWVFSNIDVGSIKWFKLNSYPPRVMLYDNRYHLYEITDFVFKPTSIIQFNVDKWLSNLDMYYYKVYTREGNIAYITTSASGDDWLRRNKPDEVSKCKIWFDVDSNAPAIIKFIQEV